jgi:hypothetical protein
LDAHPESPDLANDRRLCNGLKAGGLGWTWPTPPQTRAFAQDRADFKTVAFVRSAIPPQVSVVAGVAQLAESGDSAKDR